MSKPKSFDSWTPEKQEEWRERVRSIAKKSYVKNSKSRIEKVAKYKKSKIHVKNPSIVCSCGVKFRMRKHQIESRKHLCDRCAEIDRLEWIENDRKDQLADKKSDLRKWFKWVCKEGLYHPSVKINKELTYGSSSPMLRALVLEIEEPEFTRTAEIQPGWEFPTHVRVNGYFRLPVIRTGCDGINIYSPDWAAGIINERLGSARNRFEEWMRQCANKNWCKRDEIKRRRDWEKLTAPAKERVAMEMAEQDKRKRLQLAEKAQKEALIQKQKDNRKKEMQANLRMQKAKRYSGSFFQMQAASQSISDYIKTTNKKTA
jgi:hypothetical protein